jgi:enoyl-CoA hydratase/carnithine racemase
METDFQTVKIEFDAETGVGTVVLERPDSLNALSSQLLEDLVGGMEALESRNEEQDQVALRAIVLRGEGGNFSVGADVNDFEDASPGARSDRSHYEFIREFPAPVIAKVRGYCLGGGFETAMACDFRFAHTDARFGLPEVDFGLVPGAGGVQYVGELASPTIAKELAMTGRHIDAARAETLGLVSEVQEDGFDDRVRQFAETLASKPPLAIQAIKRSANISSRASLPEGVEFDGRQFMTLLQTNDHRKGVRAFAEEDYDPSFEGR